MGSMLPQSKLNPGKFPKEITHFFLASQKSHDKKSTFTEQYLQGFNGRVRPGKTKRQSCRIATFQAAFHHAAGWAAASACKARRRFT
jgi:hypothetical protein